MYSSLNKHCMIIDFLYFRILIVTTHRRLHGYRQLMDGIQAMDFLTAGRAPLILIPNHTLSSKYIYTKAMFIQFYMNKQRKVYM